ncbi:MAG: hypothetical protein ACYTFG_02485 [Planctomycetota bacterium]|jgi:hypothetical protein
MKLGLVAALIVICLCSQGCLSSSTTQSGSTATISGAISWTFIAAGAVSFVAGYNIDIRQGGYQREAGKHYLAGVGLELVGLITGMISGVNYVADSPESEPVDNLPHGDPANKPSLPHSTSGVYACTVPDRLGGLVSVRADRLSAKKSP